MPLFNPDNPGNAGFNTPTPGPHVTQPLNPVGLPPATPLVPVGTPLTPMGTLPTGITPPLVPLNPKPIDQTQPTGLASFIALDVREIDVEYIKDSYDTIPQQVLSMNNFSDILDMNVSIRGIAGVFFNPSDFFLPHDSIQSVLVYFDSNTLNDLPEGINTISAVISLSSNTVTTGSLFPPPPPTPVIPPNAGTFLEERFLGSSGNNGRQSPDNIFKKDPFFTQRINTINYDDRKLPSNILFQQIFLGTKSTTRIAPGVTVRWSGQFNFAVAGTYMFTVTTDDGMRIKLDDGAYFLNQYHNQNPTIYTATVNIDTAGFHLITVEYYNDYGNNTAMVSWALVNATPTPVPPGTTPPTTMNPPATPASPTTPTTPPVSSQPVPTTPSTPPDTPVVPTTPPAAKPPFGGGGGGGPPPTQTTANPINPVKPTTTTPINPPSTPKTPSGGGTSAA